MSDRVNDADIDEILRLAEDAARGALAIDDDKLKFFTHLVAALCREVQAARREQQPHAAPGPVTATDIILGLAPQQRNAPPVAAGAPSQALTAEELSLINTCRGWDRSPMPILIAIIDKLLAAAGVAGNGAAGADAGAREGK